MYVYITYIIPLYMFIHFSRIMVLLLYLNSTLASPLTSVLVKYVNHCRKFQESSSSWHQIGYNKSVYKINVHYKLFFVTSILSSCKMGSIT